MCKYIAWSGSFFGNFLVLSTLKIFFIGNFPSLPAAATLSGQIGACLFNLRKYSIVSHSQVYCSLVLFTSQYLLATSQYLEIVTCGHQILTCGNNIVNCGNQIGKIEKTVYIPSWALQVSQNDCNIYGILEPNMLTAFISNHNHLQVNVNRCVC